jgi:thioredoxin 1
MNNTNSTTVAHLTTSDFDEVLKNAGTKPVMVDFYAEWCGPCVLAAPVIEELSSEYADKAVIAKVDVDDQGELAQRYGVMSIPTVIVFKNGEEVDRKIGFAGKAGYKDLIDKAN